MATHQFTSDELHQLHDLAKQWARTDSRRAFRDAGPGLDVDFRTFEQIAHAAHRPGWAFRNRAPDSEPACRPELLA